MVQKLIIIRGNSGSGKSTIAKRLKSQIGAKTMLISQDVIRRDILGVPDESNNNAIELIYKMVMHGSEIGYNVVFEGILSKNKYGDMLKRLLHDFKGETRVFYLDISFEETLQRHATKTNAHEFGEKELREWWREKDYLNTEGEVILSSDLSEEELLKTLMLAL